MAVFVVHKTSRQLSVLHAAPDPGAHAMQIADPSFSHCQTGLYRACSQPDADVAGVGA